MQHGVIPVKTKKPTDAKLHTYILDNFEEIDANRRRPLVLICPGGGYEFTSDREGEAVAVQYMARGFHACILRYSVAPAEFPQSLCELAWSVSYLREHAKEYGIKEDKIIVSGFSAGGHLAACLGVFWNQEWLEKETGLSREQMRVNGLLLSYPVITSGAYAHQGSIENLMGMKKSVELKELLSLEHQVSKNVPPVFIWHTLTDQSVPVQNTLMFAQALVENQISVEMHIFPEGLHGLSLANEETKITKEGFGIQKRCQDWINLAGKWIADL
ncbi:MAG: alpha/beta hydrolase [Lachnospiraceae bacterium]|nr:alpha/beta hydrolase [Lachnospiraceae bacterium]MDE6186024.1 alpha/beta hydrolase [Lachnospiraceae bacterium]MDE7286038.1 alpha/beta hydrolase [Lachnospiraceae bacterium]